MKQGWKISKARNTPLWLALLMSACTPLPETKVTAVIDGDTVEITEADGTVRQLDLQFIDAPEREQPMGREARLYLQKHLLNQEVGFDSNNRLMLNDLSLNTPIARLLLQQGLAWDNSQKATFGIYLDYSEAQEQAIHSGLGIWSLEHALRIPPWQWRQDALRQSGYQQQKQRQRQTTEKTQGNQ